MKTLKRITASAKLPIYSDLVFVIETMLSNNITDEERKDIERIVTRANISHAHPLDELKRNEYRDYKEWLDKQKEKEEQVFDEGYNCSLSHHGGHQERYFGSFEEYWNSKHEIKESK